MRWSSGRFEIALKYGVRLFYRGLLERNIKKVDASFPLILPNPSLGMNITILFFILSFFATPVQRFFFNLWALTLILMQTGIFLIGIAYTKKKLKKAMSIFIAPIFLVWKMGIDIISAVGMGRKKWIRTERRL
jgi:hypothetical protein